jgi:drug/metabolite transporter (DMT)-like permease
MKKAFIQLHIAVLLAGFTGILGKLISLNEGLLVWYRLFITGVTLWLLAAIRRQNVRIDRRDLWRIIGIGGIAALHWVAFYGSIKYSNVSVGLLCFSAVGFFTAIIEPLVMRHRMDVIELFLGLLAIVGIFCIFQVDPRYKTGIALGLVSSLLASFFPVLNKRILRRVPAETVTLYELSGGCVVLTMLMPLYLWLFPAPSLVPGLADLGWLLVLSWACTVLAFNLGLLALQKISAFTVSLMYNLEPVYGILLAFVIFREDKYLNRGFYVGLGIILASIVLQTVRLVKTMKKPLLFFIFLFSFHCGGFGQSNNHDPVNKLQNYFSTYDPERAYLQFDRPYYSAGDTIFFKAYVTEGGYRKLSALSGVLYVDLINTKNEIDQSVKLRLENGVCWGVFALPDSVRGGNYRVRAYTEWMRNLGELDFFDQYIPVGILVNRAVPKNKAVVQWFPEGGTLVAGIKTKMAFKVTGIDGLGINVKGVIVDKGDKQVCSFESSHLGMGYFYLYPDKYNAYRAKLSFSDGSQTIVNLPKTDSSGISLSVVNDSTPAVSITVKANAAYYRTNKNKDFLLVIYSGGNAMKYSFKQETPTVAFDIAKKALRTGISKFTLFNQDGEPMCERSLFVQNDDQLKLQIQVDKPGYGKREKVRLLLNAKNQVGMSSNGHFSVTVADETKLSINENSERNIETGLLLALELKGYVEQPNYYFNDTSEAAKENLDLLMLTQGYRNFEWKRVLGNDSAGLVFHPEKGLEIGGKITDLSNLPVADGTVTFVPSRGGPLVTSKSDKNGIFSFSNLVFIDTLHGVLSAVNSKGSNTTRITYFKANHKPPKVHDLVYALPSSSALPTMADTSVPSSGRGTLLQPVMVKSVTHDNQYRTQSLAGAGFADQVIHFDDLQRVGEQLSTRLNGRLRGVVFINGVPYLTTSVQNSNMPNEHVEPMLIVLDGTEIRAGRSLKIDDIPADEVETVEVLKTTSTSMYGMEGSYGVLIITTRNGSGENKDISSVGVLPITPVGFCNVPGSYSGLRSTIYWNPEIRTDSDGNSSVEYYNADRPGIYKIIVEGIDDNGNLGRLVYRYKVE